MLEMTGVERRPLEGHGKKGYHAQGARFYWALDPSGARAVGARPIGRSIYRALAPRRSIYRALAPWRSIYRALAPWRSIYRALAPRRSLVTRSRQERHHRGRSAAIGSTALWTSKAGGTTKRLATRSHPALFYPLLFFLPLAPALQNATKEGMS
jgi:hypothetical protein